MRAFVAVFFREIEEHRFVFLVGAFLALVALAAPLLPLGTPRTDVREATALVLAAAYALILAVGFGLTGIASEIASGRHSFFMSRPIGPRPLLAGKLAAFVVLATGGSLLAGAPSASFFSRFETAWEYGVPAAAAIVAMVLIIGVTHFLSLAFRARDAWLAVDMAWITAVVLIGYWSYDQLYTAFAGSLWKWLLSAGLLFLVPAVLLAWVFQVSRGRSDLVRSHRWMSAALGCLTLVISAWLASSCYRAAHPAPGDVWRLQAVRVASSDWLYLAGKSGAMFGRDVSFFWNVSSDEYFRMDSARSVTFDDRLEKAAWIARSNPSQLDADLYWVDLSVAQPTPIKGPATIAFHESQLSLSPGGSRLAVWDASKLSVLDLVSGTPIFSRRLEPGVLKLAFRDADTLQLLSHERRGARKKVFRLETIGLEASEATLIATEALPFTSKYFRWFEEGQRLISGSALLDLGSGKIIAELNSSPSPRESSRHRFLSDGRIVEYGGDGESSWLQLYDRNGNKVRRFQLPPASYLRPGGQPNPDEVILTVSRDGEPGTHSISSLILNLKDGSTRELGPFIAVSSADDPPGTPSVEFFLDAGHSLWKLSEDGSRSQVTRGYRTHAGLPTFRPMRNLLYPAF